MKKKICISLMAAYAVLLTVSAFFHISDQADKNTQAEKYEAFVRQNIGEKRVIVVRKSDIKRYYKYLADKRYLKAATDISNESFLGAYIRAGCGYALRHWRRSH